MAKWTITPQSNGSFHVRSPRGRIHVSDDEESAIRYVKKTFQSGEKVFLADPKDGYLTQITRQVHRSRT